MRIDDGRQQPHWPRLGGLPDSLHRSREAPANLCDRAHSEERASNPDMLTRSLLVSAHVYRRRGYPVRISDPAQRCSVQFENSILIGRPSGT